MFCIFSHLQALKSAERQLDAIIYYIDISVVVVQSIYRHWYSSRQEACHHVMVCLTAAEAPQILLPPDISKLKYLNLCINITLHAVLYDRETWSNTIKEKHTEGAEGNVSN